MSHYLEYKSETDVPSDLRRDFYALSGLFYVADKHFEMFFGSKAESREQLEEAFAEPKPPLDQEINLDNLAAYLTNKFPDRRHANAKDLSELITELTRAGIRHISELDRDIERSRKAFALCEKERPPSVPDKRFMDIGVVRVVLEITNDNFRKVRRRKYQSYNLDLSKYQALLE